MQWRAQKQLSEAPFPVQQEAPGKAQDMEEPAVLNRLKPDFEVPVVAEQRVVVRVVPFQGFGDQRNHGQQFLPGNGRTTFFQEPFEVFELFVQLFVLPVHRSSSVARHGRSRAGNQLRQLYRFAVSWCQRTWQCVTTEEETSTWRRGESREPDNRKKLHRGDAETLRKTKNKNQSRQSGGSSICAFTWWRRGERQRTKARTGSEEEAALALPVVERGGSRERGGLRA